MRVLYRSQVFSFAGPASACSTTMSSPDSHASGSGQEPPRTWSCDTLIRGCSFLAQQQALQDQKMTAQDALAAILLNIDAVVYMHVMLHCMLYPYNM